MTYNSRYIPPQYHTQTQNTPFKSPSNLISNAPYLKSSFSFNPNQNSMSFRQEYQNQFLSKYPDNQSNVNNFRNIPGQNNAPPFENSMMYPAHNFQNYPRNPPPPLNENTNYLPNTIKKRALSPSPERPILRSPNAFNQNPPFPMQRSLNFNEKYMERPPQRGYDQEPPPYYKAPLENRAQPTMYSKPQYESHFNRRPIQIPEQRVMRPIQNMPLTDPRLGQSRFEPALQNTPLMENQAFGEKRRFLDHSNSLIERGAFKDAYALRDPAENQYFGEKRRFLDNPSNLIERFPYKEGYRMRDSVETHTFGDKPRFLDNPRMPFKDDYLLNLRSPGFENKDPSESINLRRNYGIDPPILPSRTQPPLYNEFSSPRYNFGSTIGGFHPIVSPPRIKPDFMSKVSPAYPVNEYSFPPPLNPHIPRDYSTYTHNEKKTHIDKDCDDLVEILKEYIFFDRKVQESKENVCRRPDFKLIRLIKEFDDNETGQIVFSEFKKGLLKYGVKAEDSDIGLVINRYTRDGNNKLDYNEFAHMVLPSSDLNKSHVLSKEDKIEKMSIETNNSIAHMFKMLLNCHYSCELLRKDLVHKKVNLHKAFEYISGLGKNNAVNKEALAKFLEKYFFYATKEDIHNLMETFDRNNTGLINKNEFLYELTPKLK